MNKHSSKISKYYYDYLERSIRLLVPKFASSVIIDTNNWKTVRSPQNPYDYVIITNAFSYIPDVQRFIQQTIRRFCHSESRVIIISFNFLWKPLLDIASSLGIRKKDPYEPNWLSPSDVTNIMQLEGFELIKIASGLLIPFHIPIISSLVNTYLAPLPGFSNLGLVQTMVFWSKPQKGEYSVSLIVPARNEEGNIPNLLDRIPNMGRSTEILFIEGHSKDNTYDAIKKEIARYKGPIRSRVLKQNGIGKKDAVELGFSKVKNEVVIIFDADLTVDPSELPKFYRAIADGFGELIIGTRLVYPMEKQAMRTLNYIGNKFFSLAFSFLLGQRIKDTLCGTKAIFKNTYSRILHIKKLWGDIDPYGDFDLIFGASKLNLKIVEIPVRYKERSYGTSNISRFEHGLLLLRMTLAAAQKLKFNRFQ